MKDSTNIKINSSIDGLGDGLVVDNSIELQDRAHALIPGGSHTYAKGDDQFPEHMPIFIERGHGCHIWDADGNRYIEYGMGLRAVTLGHAYEPVVLAAHDQLFKGSNFSRPASIEIECAETLVDLIDGADQVKFSKDGSSTTTAAIKLARAFTGRDRIAICGNQPFFSYDDWFIGSTPMARGIPEATKQLTVLYSYNDLESVESVFKLYPDEVACLILEPARIDEPENGFLERLKEICHKNGALLIFDEIITGFRWHLSGAQNVYDVTPDLSTFGKGMANGFSVSALVGKKEIMELGGILHEQERVFLLSTTHGAETHSLAAALATMQIYKEEPVIEVLYNQGDRLRKGINQIIDTLGLQGHFEILGRSCNMIYATRDQNKVPSQSFRTLFLQELMTRGIVAPSFVVSYTHSDEVIDETVEIVGEALQIYGRALDDGIDAYLAGRPVKPVFRPFN